MFEKNSIRAAGGSRRKTFAALATALAVAGVAVFGGVTDAQAAPGVVSDLGVSIAFDGTAGFNADDAPGNDSGPNNGIVRANDQIEYLVASSFASVGDVRYTSTLPIGMEWDSTATATTVCNGPGGGALSNANRTWTCNRTTDTLAESFKVRAWATSAGNGAVLAPTFTVGAASATAPPVTVSALAKTEMRHYVQTLAMPFVNGGRDGVRQHLSVYVGATIPAAGDFKGFEALSDEFSFQASVPPHAVMIQAEPTYGTSGTVRYTQDGGPGTPVTVTIKGTRTDFLQNRLAAGNGNGYRTVAQFSLFIWTPFDPTIPVNVPTVLSGQLSGFDPVSASGQSNFGDGYAVGHLPSDICTPDVAGGTQLSCYGQSILRKDTAVVYGGNGGAVASTSNTYIYGDNHGYVTGYEFVVPGQRFYALSSVRNDTTAGAAATGAWGVAAWDTKKFQLTGTPEVRYNSTNGNGEAFYVFAGSAIPSADYILKYTDHAFASDAERKNFDPATVTWVTNPNALVGGIASVSAVHATYLKPLKINSAFGLANPLARTVTDASLATAANTALPWFWQYGSDEQPRVPSVYGGVGTSTGGGSVRAAEALIRTTTSWGNSSTDPGNISNLIVTPTVIGPVGSPKSTVAKDTKIKVALGSTCGEPVWAVVKGLAGYSSHTPANAGPDGILCTADDGAPASIVFDLGDIEAPSGAAGPGVYQGHATAQPTITIPVGFSALTPSGSIHTATVVASSNSDMSISSWAGWTNLAPNAMSQDRTETASITVQGVASFQGGKTANTRESGLVSPDEEFSYTINWANGTSDKVGVGTFVDLLPYNGDARGSDGLPAEGFTVIEASASTANTAVMGDVSIEYSVDESDAIAAALLQPDNSDGHSGITWKTGTIPSNARALRFVTEKPIDSGFSGSATITVALKGLAIGGQLKNDFYGKTTAVNGDDNSIKRIVGAAEVTLASSAGSLAGSVWRDLDFSNSLTPDDGTWPKGTKTLTITSTNETYTTDIGDDGSFDFGVIAAGDYVASVKDSNGWALVLPDPITFTMGQELTDEKILFQQKLKPLELKPDAGSTSAGASTTVDVKKNDSWFTAAAPAPQTAASIQPGGEAAYGTATITADGSLTYVSASEWPDAFAGQASYEDVVTYTVTDSAGATATSVVTITVYAAPAAANDMVTITQAGTQTVDVLANASGHELEVATATTAGDLNVTNTNGKVSIESTHVWADGEATYNTVVTYSIVDAFGQPATAEIAVSVQRAPVVTVDAEQTVPADGVAVFEPQLLNPGVVDASDITVTAKPKQGSVTIGDDGTVTFTPGDAKPGNYTFTVSYTDNLGQTTTQDFTVTVYEALAAKDDSATIAWVRGSEVDVLANDTGDGVTLTTATLVGTDTGTVEIRDGKLFFTPSTDREWVEGELSYVETLEYGVIDAHGTEATATVTLTVVKPPVGKDLHVDLESDVELVTFDPIGEATGTKIQQLASDAVIAQPANGTASIVDGVLTYAPNAGFAGDDTFTVRIEDALGQIGEVTYTVTVAAADIPETKVPETGGDNGGTDGGTGGTPGGNGGGASAAAPSSPAGLAVTGSDASVWLLGLVLLAAGAAFGLLTTARGSRRRLVKGISHES